MTMPGSDPTTTDAASGPKLDMRCIEPMPNGKFRVNKLVRDKSAQGRGAGKGKPRERIFSEVFGTHAEAITARNAIEAKLLMKLRPGGLTFQQWGDQWLDELEDAPKAELNPDLASIRSRYRLHIATAHFATKSVGAISQEDVKEWLKDLEKKQAQKPRGKKPKNPKPGKSPPPKVEAEPKLLSKRTRKRTLTLLRTILQAAVDDPNKRCQCTANVALGIFIKTGKRERLLLARVDKDVPLIVREIETLLSDYGDDPERHLPEVAIGTGMRQGEQWNLELKDVHLRVPDPVDPTKELSYIDVRYGKKDHGPTKSGKPRRIPLFGMGLSAMEAWLAILPTYAPENPLGLVFPTPKTSRSRGGYRRGKSKVPKSWIKRQKARILGKDRKFWWHALRHTFATALLCGWWKRRWSLHEVAELLGHSSTEVTEMYAHMLDSALSEAAAEVQAAFTQSKSVAAPAGVPGDSRSALEGMMRSAAIEGNMALVRALASALDASDGKPSAPPIPPAPAPNLVPAAAAPTPLQPTAAIQPTYAPRGVVRNVRRGPGRRVVPATRPSASMSAEGDAEGPRASHDPLPQQLTTDLGLGTYPGLHPGSFAPEVGTGSTLSVTEGTLGVHSAAATSRSKRTPPPLACPPPSAVEALSNPIVGVSTAVTPGTPDGLQASRPLVVDARSGVAGLAVKTGVLGVPRVHPGYSLEAPHPTPTTTASADGLHTEGLPGNYSKDECTLSTPSVCSSEGKVDPLRIHFMEKTESFREIDSIYGTEGRRFESFRARKQNQGVGEFSTANAGSTLDPREVEMEVDIAASEGTSVPSGDGQAAESSPSRQEQAPQAHEASVDGSVREASESDVEPSAHGSSDAGGSLVARAQMLMRFAAAGRQDARRVAEDLAMGVLMSASHKRLHETARRVLDDAEHTIPRGLELAVRVIGPEPKPRKKRATR